MPHTPILAMTVTATAHNRNEIKRSLGMQNVLNVKANPDRENIFYEVHPRGNQGDEKLITIIEPLALKLKEKLLAMPFTIFYSHLETCGECYSYFEQELGPHQFYPAGSPLIFSNRLLHETKAQYPEEYHGSLVENLMSGTATARVLFVTVAYGVGINVPTVERVIHIGVPYTMEKFFQETGRAGRNGSQTISTVYFNSYDISKAKRALEPIMRQNVTANSCRQEIIIRHFGASVASECCGHKCCDNCKHMCKCSNCCT